MSQIAYTSGRDLLVGSGCVRACFSEDDGSKIEGVLRNGFEGVSGRSH